MKEHGQTEQDMNQMKDNLRRNSYIIKTLIAVSYILIFPKKYLACIGSADSNSLKPICEQCGLGCYSVLVAQGIKGVNG